MNPIVGHLITIPPNLQLHVNIVKKNFRIVLQFDHRNKFLSLLGAPRAKPFSNCSIAGIYKLQYKGTRFLMLQVMFCNHYLLERRKLMVGKLLPSLGGHLNTSKSQQPREAAFKYDDLTCQKKKVVSDILWM